MPDRPDIPDEIRRLADARRDARAERQFDEADRLKSELEAAGWAVVDKGARYRLTPMHPPDVADGARTRFGWSGAVPPPPVAGAALHRASVILVATDRPDDLERALAGLAGAVDDDVQRIVVANGPSAEQETALVRWEEHWLAAGGNTTAAATGVELGLAETGRSDEAAGIGPAEVASSTEVVWLASRLGAAAALNAGFRRATADVVILLDARAEPVGDFVTPLVRALADASVAVTGPWGLVSGNQRHFEPATGQAAGDGADVAAIDLACVAFRRRDLEERGPLDERFWTDALLGPWWSLVLRDATDDAEPRRAVVTAVPVVRHGPEVDAARQEAAERRNRYRLIDRFGNRRDLAVSPEA